MKIFSVGSTELGEYELDEAVKGGKFEWLVYDYKYECWEGTGEAVLLGKDGLIYTVNLGHCSCYGPLERFVDRFSGTNGVTAEEFLRPKDSIFDDEPKEVLMLVVRGLLAQR